MHCGGVRGRGALGVGSVWPAGRFHSGSVSDRGPHLVSRDSVGSAAVGHLKHKPFATMASQTEAEME